ncbi:MAG: DUF4404 family protein [Polyangiales bacterium]
MPRQRLQDALSILHEQLEASEELGEEDRAALVEAMKDIRHALSSPEAADEDPEGALSARVYGLIEELETTHPKFAEILRNVSESLANLGI